jgi:hypothetical protein
MSVCTVNGQPFDVPAGMKTWGQLLEGLEQGTDAARTVVTAVRFSGVDQPSFREAMMHSLELGAQAPIDVETSQAGVLLSEAAATALQALDALAVAIQDSAEAFRCHDIADANGRLTDITLCLQNLTGVTEVIAQAAARPEAQVATDRTALLAGLNQGLEALVDAMTREDWIAMADVLTYDLTDLLPSWRAFLTSQIELASR